MPATQPLIDAAGTRHQPAGPAARIVSLVPSLTELLFDLGLGARVVGRTAFCVHPRDKVAAVPSVGGTKRVNMKKLMALRPTHAIVNVDENPEAMARELAGLGVRVVVTHPTQPEDNIGLYRLLGGLFGAADAAEALVRDFRAGLAAVAGAARLLPERRVLYLIWKDPWMTVGADTYIARFLALIDWLCVGDAPGARYPEIALAEPLLAGTDLVLFSSEPYAFTRDHLGEFAAAFPGHASKARLVDAEMLSWYGSRAIPGLAYLQGLAETEATAAD
jgi:ABC-type Fe3+-hydroxamate transport system substrate-binding protein